MDIGDLVELAARRGAGGVHVRADRTRPEGAEYTLALGGGMLRDAVERSDHRAMMEELARMQGGSVEPVELRGTRERPLPGNVARVLLRRVQDTLHAELRYRGGGGR